MIMDTRAQDFFKLFGDCSLISNCHYVSIKIHDTDTAKRCVMTHLGETVAYIANFNQFGLLSDLDMIKKTFERLFDRGLVDSEKYFFTRIHTIKSDYKHFIYSVEKK